MESPDIDQWESKNYPKQNVLKLHGMGSSDLGEIKEKFEEGKGRERRTSLDERMRLGVGFYTGGVEQLLEKYSSQIGQGRKNKIWTTLLDNIEIDISQLHAWKLDREEFQTKREKLIIASLNECQLRPIQKWEDPWKFLLDIYRYTKMPIRDDILCDLKDGVYILSLAEKRYQQEEQVFKNISCADFFSLFHLGEDAKKLCSDIANRDISEDTIDLECIPKVGTSSYSIAKNKICVRTREPHFERIALQELVHKFLHERYPYANIDADRAVQQLQKLTLWEKRCFSDEYLEDFYIEPNLRSHESTSRIMHEGFVDMLMLQDVLRSGDYETAKWEIHRILKKTNTLTKIQTYRLSADLMAIMLDVTAERDRTNLALDTSGSVAKRNAAFARLESKEEEEMLYGKTRTELLNMCADLIPKLHKTMQESMMESENK